MEHQSALLRVLAGRAERPPPVWLMRQAGRYLPEYRALRAAKGGFLELLFDPEAAAEVTLQPIRRFGFDAAILFSDILVVPLALGQQVWFEAGEGPRLAPANPDPERLVHDASRLAPIGRTVSLVRAALDPSRSLIGFAGSPWTVATYMIAGAGSRDQGEARTLAFADPQRMSALIDRIVGATLSYAQLQLASGVDAFMLFDSWAGSLSPAAFERWVIAPTARIVEALGSQVPIIGFPRGGGLMLGAYAQQTGVSAVALDETIPPAAALQALPPGLPVQGNLDPWALKAGGAALEREVAAIIDAFAGRPHILNLGHGIDKSTPIAHVEQLMSLVRERG